MVSPDSTSPHAPLARLLGRTRFIVLLAVVAVILAALSLFLLGAIQAVDAIWRSWAGVLHGRLETTELTVRFLEIVSAMLKAVVFYLIGVGLYSLFVAPLNIAVAMGVETLYDLESKVISVVVVIMAITFLEHFIQWVHPTQTLQFAGALALAVGSLVLFQAYSHRAKEDQREHDPDIQRRARHELFDQDHEEHQLQPEELARRDHARRP